MLAPRARLTPPDSLQYGSPLAGRAVSSRPIEKVVSEKAPSEAAAGIYVGDECVMREMKLKDMMAS